MKFWKSTALLGIGVIVGQLISGQVGFADTARQTIEASLDRIHLYIDGKEASFQEASLPTTILYKDTTYVPLRMVAKAFNQSLSYDSTTNTASMVDAVKTPIVAGSIEAKVVPTDSSDGKQHFLFSLKNQTEQVQSITFNSTQRYGYVITDENGKQIKLWPMGIMFGYVVSTVELKQGEELTYPITIDSLPKGVYSIKVWSSADEKYNAVTKFEVK
jgi:hypothetical protein